MYSYLYEKRQIFPEFSNNFATFTQYLPNCKSENAREAAVKIQRQDASTLWKAEYGHLDGDFRTS